jgi:hypothetical protein
MRDALTWRRATLFIMSSSLESALEHSRPAIEAALAEAEAELATLKTRESELERLIARARAALGEAIPQPSPASPRPLTLHEALRTILLENGNEWTPVDDLARAVNARGLYAKRDGSPVQPSQIHARASSYPTMFEKDGPRVRLVDPT